MIGKNMRRFLVLGMLGLFMISMMAGVLGTDYSKEAAEAATTVVSGFSGFFGTLLAPLFGEKEMLSRVFFAILLGMIIYSVISVMFTGKKWWIRWGITGAITCLALLGLPSGFLEAIRIQYGAMGAAILTIIPFIIVLIFSLRTGSILTARVTWIFYSVYYLAMYLHRALFEVSTAKAGWLTTTTIPYLGGFVAGIIIFFFVPAIRDLMFKGEIEGIKESGEQVIAKGKLLKQLQGKELETYK